MEEGFPKHQAAELFDQYVDAYVANHFRVDKYSRVLDHFIQLLPTTPIQLLDIACGPGNLTHYVSARLPQANCLGIDLSPQMILAAQRHNPNASFQVMDIRDIDQIEGRFDGILLGFGLPYLSEMEGKRLINDIEGKLVPGGLLCISTTLGNQTAKLEHSSKGEGIWQFLWEEQALVAVLSKAFTLVYSETLQFQYGERPPVMEWVGVLKRC